MHFVAASFTLIHIGFVVVFSKEDFMEAVTAWRGSKLYLKIPKDYPTENPLLKLELLKPSRRPSFTYKDDIPQEKKRYLCRSQKRSLSIANEFDEEKLEKKIFKRNILEEGRRERRNGRGANRRREGNNIDAENGRGRARGRGKNGGKRKKAEAMELKSDRRDWGNGREKEDDILLLRGEAKDLVYVTFDERSRLVSFFLKRSLHLQDYVKTDDSWIEFSVHGKEEETGDSCDEYLREEGGRGEEAQGRRKRADKKWRKLFDVKLFIIEPFICDILTESMCFLPDGEIELQQWENVAPGPIFVLPSLETFCPDVRRSIRITMKGSNNNPELEYSESMGSFQTSMTLDREARNSWLNFTVTCNIQSDFGSERKWKKSSGYLFLKDEDDNAPIRLKKERVLWGIADNLDHLDDEILIIDPDIDDQNDYKIEVEGVPYNLIVVESISKYGLSKEHCAYETEALRNESAQFPLNADCTVITAFIKYDKTEVSSHPAVISFSVNYIDSSLVNLNMNNKVGYNVTLIPSNSRDPSNGGEVSIEFAKLPLNFESELNISLARPLHEYARIAQIIKPHSNLHFLYLTMQDKFTLDQNSLNHGVDITPVLGILHVLNSSKLERALNNNEFIEVTIYRGSNFNGSVYLRWSGVNNTCDQKRPKPPYIRVGDHLPTSCAIHSYKSDCEESCGLGSLFGRCFWRGPVGTFKSRQFATCSPDLSTCPDQYCDELEEKNPKKICPQDCIDEKDVKGQYIDLNYDFKPPKGILKGFGVCTCNDYCQCFPAFKEPIPEDEIQEGQMTSSNSDGYEEEICGTTCLISVSIIVFVSIVTCFILICRKRKDCGNKFKDGEIGRTHYPSDYVDDHSSSYASGPPHGEAHAVALHSVHNFHHTSPRIHSINNNNQELLSDLPIENFCIDHKWEFPRNKLVIEQTLGEGEFGKVMRAKAQGIGGNPGCTTVAVKMLKSNSTASELSDLLSEYDLLKEVMHPNVVRLMGACTKKGGPVYLIMEYCKYGSLRSYLRQSRHFEFESRVGSAPIEDSPGDFKITPKQLLSFAWQICKGMAYLSNMKLVHRDLAARNVLLAEGKICKISDFGLTRDVYEGDLYFKRSKGRVPVKWMAIESLVDHVYTSKSDIWGFGVLLWELVTLGSSPYPGITPETLFSLLKSGHRMERPDNCSEELYDVMKSCWMDNPSRRPTFTELTQLFERMIEADVEYLELRSLIVTNRSYFDESLAPQNESQTIPIVQVKEVSPKSNKRENESENLIFNGDMRTDQDAYLVARSTMDDNQSNPRRDSSEPLLPMVTPSPISIHMPTSHSTHITTGIHLHAHNPAYSPTSEEGPPILLPIPPPLQYSTLENGPDEEEDAGIVMEEAQDGCRSEGDSDSGRATGDSGYLTEEGRKSRGAPQSFGKPLGSSKHSRGGSYSPLTPHEIEDEQDTSEDFEERQELLTEDLPPNGLLTPSPSIGNRTPIPNGERRKSSPSSSSSSSSVSPSDGFNAQQRARRNPVIV